MFQEVPKAQVDHRSSIAGALRDYSPLSFLDVSSEYARRVLTDSCLSEKNASTADPSRGIPR